MGGTSVWVRELFFGGITNGWLWLAEGPGMWVPVMTVTYGNSDGDVPRYLSITNKGNGVRRAPLSRHFCINTGREVVYDTMQVQEKIMRQ